MTKVLAMDKLILGLLLVLGAPASMATDLVSLTHPVVVVTEHDDGVRETNHGLGFTIGNLFYTTHHSIPPGDATTVYVRTSPLIPVSFEPNADLAVFEVPDELCREICGAHQTGAVARGGIQRVSWLQPVSDGLEPVSASVVEMVYFGAVDDVDGCSDDAVVALDRAILPGTSGAPVLDADTGLIVGMAQGSFTDGRGTFGYFRPIRCIVGELQAEKRSRHTVLVRRDRAGEAGIGGEVGKPRDPDALFGTLSSKASAL